METTITLSPDLGTAPTLGLPSRTPFPQEELVGIGWNLAVSHKAIVVPGPQGWPFGLVGSASRAGEWGWWRVWGGGVTRRLGCSPLASSILRVPLDSPGHSKKWVSFSVPQTRGARRPPKPDGGFVCLGSQPGEPITFLGRPGKWS